MPPRCIVTDLDRTLTGADLALDAEALSRIDALRRGGIRVVVATGRRFDDLLSLGIVERVDGLVAENGAIVCVPSETILETHDAGFAAAARDALGARLARRFQWGRVVGSGPRALADDAAQRLRKARVEHHVEFNAEEAMLLPPGIDKAFGAATCVKRLGLTAEDAWAIGDGENDASLLRWARLGAAPANAAPAARDAADVQLASAYSRAFVELTAPLLVAEPMLGE